MTTPKPARWLFDHPRLGRFARYGAGSALASLTSAVTLAVVYRLSAGPQVASVAAFVAGACVNFLLYRFWAWRVTIADTARVGRDLARFTVVAVTTALVALAATTIADKYAQSAHLSGLTRTLVVEGAYFGAFAVMFVAKFLVLDRFVFGSRAAADSNASTVASEAASATGAGSATTASGVGTPREATMARGRVRRRRRSRHQVESTTRA